VSGSVSAGDPVVVVGAISTDHWETDTGRRSKPRIRARAVGHNLHWGISAFTKLKRPGVASDGDPAMEPSGSGLPVDASDEEYAAGVDELTGELLSGPPGGATPDTGGIRRGRDYVTDPGALHSLTTDDLPAEPAHA
jgi:single-strand DNA-binding protein